jgi:hypothetical protein
LLQVVESVVGKLLVPSVHQDDEWGGVPVGVECERWGSAHASISLSLVGVPMN